jgi:SAM-dependent methyltransferase
VEEAEFQAILDHEDRHWWYRGRLRIVRREVEQLGLPRGARILDAGCGSGRVLDELARFGDVVGVDLSPSAVAAAWARGHSVAKARVEELPFDDATFDLVTCLDVIEHTPDDAVTLASLRRVCKPGGWLLVTVPAYQALWSRHDVANHHYRRYSRGALRTAAAAGGWSVIRMTSFNSLLLAPAAAVRLAQRWRGLDANGDYTPDLHIGPGWLNGVLERPLRAEARWLQRGRELPAGLSLLGVLRNPDT